MGVCCIKIAVCKLGAIRKMENGRFLYMRRYLQVWRCLENGKWAFFVFFVSKALFANWALFEKWKKGVFCIKDGVCKLGAIRKMVNGRFLYKRRCLQVKRCLENEKRALIV